MRRWILIFLCLLVFGLVISVNAQATPTPAPNLIETGAQQLEGLAANLQERFDRVSQNDLMRFAMIIGGTVLLLIGWRIYSMIIWIAGALAGASLALVIVNTDSFLIGLIAMIIGGIIGSALAGFLYYVAVFMIGLYIGGLLAAQAVIAFNLPIDFTLAVIGGALFGALLLVALSFELLVILSSIVGGQMLALGLGLDVRWALGFIVFGILFQLFLVRTFNYQIRRRPARRMLGRGI